VRVATRSAKIGRSPAGAVRGLAVAAAVLLALAAGAQHRPAQARGFPERQSLSAADVERVLRQAVAEAQARRRPGTIAVVDRVGNVLAVYRVNGAAFTFVIDPERGVESPAGLADPALNNLRVLPATLAAIAKAITGAYLSSNSNAFSTRTANTIVQENFLPGSTNLEGGPLFGVQISSLPCSDLTGRFASDSGGFIDRTAGPKRSPLGLSADPGGFPLYKGGILVGGVGVLADGRYGLDRDIRDRDQDTDELIAAAGARGFNPAETIRADRITADGRTFRFSDVSQDDLDTDEDDAARVNLATAGAFTFVRGYYDAGRAIAGQTFGFRGSGIERDPDGIFGSESAYVLTDGSGRPRFRPRTSRFPGGLTAAEVTRILQEALRTALQARGQIQRPLGDNNMEVTISVVDTDGSILGIVRTPDGLVFGTDVSLQKARSANLFSNRNFRADLARIPYLGDSPNPTFRALGRQAFTRASVYGDRLVRFIETDVNGAVAFSNRSIGNLARPFFPDGINENANGPLSLPFRNWSPFNTGLQVDAVAANIVQHVLFVRGGFGLRDTPAQCAGIGRLANGLQIFPGGFPIYRGETLVGGIGLSGDGIDQDELVAFLGVDRARRALNTGVQNAPRDRRADRLDPQNTNLRYVQCPYAPFLNSDDQSVCEGK
jgi:uncharacterized protein GlcG (DUF336 family)